MIAALIVLQFLTLVALIALLVRRNTTNAQDPRLAQLLASDLPAQFTRLDARSEALDSHIREALGQMRTDIAAEAQRTREASSTDFGSLRTEIASIITNLGITLNTGLDSFRTDNKTSSEALRAAVQKSLDAIDQRLTSFASQNNSHQLEAQAALHNKLTELGAAQAKQQDQLRSMVEAQLNTINQNNEKKLDEMRQTVDEKLNETLHIRLTESFGQVTTHLGEVQKGLGEMKELAVGVGDLKKIFSNVSSRGSVGQFLVEQQLKQKLSPEQYERNVQIKPDTRERVEFALKIPGTTPGEFSLLSIDSKFPTSDWERLELAYEQGTKEERDKAGKEFERLIRAEGQKICEKYIYPPRTLPHAIMVLPTEGLYAEVVRRPGLQSQIQESYQVTITGPSTFMAILMSFQLGFNSITYQKKSDEIGKILSAAKHEFGKFGGLMEKVGNQVGTVQNTLKLIHSKTTTINHALKNVASLESGDSGGKLLAFDEPAGLPMDIAAAANDDE